MSKGAHDVFAFIINFLKGDWQPKHVTLGLFEITNISKKTLAKNLIEIFKKYNLKKKIIIYVKDEKSNLNTMIVTLKIVISCDNLSLEESYQGICFGHAFSKAYQYATMDKKVCKNFDICFY